MEMTLPFSTKHTAELMNSERLARQRSMFTLDFRVETLLVADRRRKQITDLIEKGCRLESTFDRRVEYRFQYSCRLIGSEYRWHHCTELVRIHGDAAVVARVIQVDSH
jgi:hypothetical protein